MKEEDEAKRKFNRRQRVVLPGVLIIGLVAEIYYVNERGVNHLLTWIALVGALMIVALIAAWLTGKITGKSFNLFK